MADTLASTATDSGQPDAHPSASPVTATNNNTNTNTDSAGVALTNGADSDSDSEVSVAADAELDEDELLANEATPTKPHRHKRQNSDMEAKKAGDNALDRLDYLLMKTEQFAALVKPKQSNAQSGISSASKRTVGEKEKEKAEDAELLQTEQREVDAGDDTVLQAYKNPDCVKAVMRDYQIEALNWMLRLHHGKINGILADEMGLGKTLMSLSLLQFLKHCGGYNGPHLVIVPKSTLVNWSREVERWTHLSVLSFHGNQAERSILYDKLGTTDVCVTTYEMVIREKAQFKHVNWHYVVIDEAHRIKNEKSLLSRVVRTIPSEHRLLITGTPLQNNLHEMWALLNFLVPSLFGSSDDFDTWFDITDTQQQQQVIQRLHRILRPFLLRRLKSDVEKSLPPKTETKLLVGLTPMQRQWYTKLLERDIELLNATASSAGKTRLLNIVMQLRKVCNHPYLFFGAEHGPPFIEGDHIIENAGKMVLLDKLVKRLMAQGSRVLIFSQMTRMLDILEDYMRYRGYDYCRIDGSTKHDERETAMDEFNAPNSSKFAFLLSTRAGGLGINLQTADTVVLYDSDWNPQMDLQAQDRAHRIGQKKPVFVYRFVTEQTVEQKIVERALKKLFLDTVVIKQGRLIDADKSMSATELQNMVKFGVQQIFSGNNTSSVHDDDIDTILQRGHQATSDEQDKLKTSFNNNLLSFDNSDEQSSLVFEGKDYRGIRADNATGAIRAYGFIEPPKRQRKTNYNESHYFHNAIYGSTGEHAKAPVKREYKPTARFDFQFFNVDRLEQLERKEHESQIKLTELQRVAREQAKEAKRIAKLDEVFAKRKAKYAKRADKDKPVKMDTEYNGTAEVNGVAVKSEQAEDTQTDTTAVASSNSDTAAGDVKTAVKPEATTERTGDASPVEPDSAVSDTENDDAADDNESIQSNDNDNAIEANTDDTDAMNTEAGVLTPEERAEKERLIENGFADWSKRDFQLFVKAMEKFGRNDVEHIADTVNKSVEDVERYHTAFWAKYKQIENYDKIIQTIEKGEERLKKLESIQQSIARKIERTGSDVLDSMTLQYTTTQKQWTELEDKYLLYTLHTCGYGNWDDIKRSICRSYVFRFDWYIKSRNNQELARRAEYLVKLVQKEEELLKQQAIEAEKKAKAAEARKRAADKKRAAEAAAEAAAAIAKKSPSKQSGGSGQKAKLQKSDSDAGKGKQKDSKPKSSSTKSSSVKAKSSATGKENSKSTKSKSTKSDTDKKKRSKPQEDSESDNESLAVKKAKHTSTTKSDKTPNKQTDKNAKQTGGDTKSKTPSKTPSKTHEDDKSTKKIDTFFKPNSSSSKHSGDADDVTVLTTHKQPSGSSSGKPAAERQSSTESMNGKGASHVSPSSKVNNSKTSKIPKKNDFVF